MSAASLTEQERAFIAEAARFLERPTLIMKLTKAIGKPVDTFQQKLPARAQHLLSKAVETSLNTALKISIKTIKGEPQKNESWSRSAHQAKVSGWAHTAGAAVSGAFGGLFGMASLPVELPLSTGVMLRGISQAAANWGFDVQDPAVQLQCVYVFTLGSGGQRGDEEAGYLASRIAFSKVISEAAVYLGKFSAKELFMAVERGSATIFAKFITRVAARFEVAVTEKMIAGAVPLAGAVGSAAINAAFCDHYVTAARYHFGIMRLEEKYGAQAVQELFARESRDIKGGKA